MPLIDRSFVDGLFWRMLAIGAVAASVAAAVMSFRIGYSIAIGTATAALSLRITSFVISRLFEGILRENPKSAGWVLILVVKMFILAMVIWISLATMNVNIFAFVVGYKMIFPALIWQKLHSPDHFDGPDHETDEAESL